MSHIAEFRVRSPDLALASALEAVPEMRLELLQEVGTHPTRPYLFLWAMGGDIERFEAAMAEDETVTDVERYLELDEETLYRMRITPETEVVSYPTWVEVGAEQLAVHYADGWWHNRLRLPDREALSTIREWCDDVGVTFELECVYSDDPTSVHELTAPQREALRAAYEAGYFEVPRDASMNDIADRLDISGQAVSERLRRAHQTLVARYFDDFSSA